MKLTGKKELIEIIKKKIEEEGAISFKDFMDIALYYPDLGYYTSDKEKIGGFGDFFTSSEVDKAFGQLLAKQFAEIFYKINPKEKFQIIEIGAGKGYLAYDILQTLKIEYNEIYQKSEYILIEKSKYHIKTQKELLKDFEIAKWVESLESFEDNSIEGVIFSNELFDAFPVHIVEKQNNNLYEIYISLKDDEVIEIKKEASKEIIDYFKELNVELPEGIRTEVNLIAKDFIQLIGRKLKKGFVITIDYGYPSNELYKEYRPRGTILCYHKHKYSENFYQNVGLQDITSHVNFSALKYFGEKVGLNFVAFTDQAHFLINLGIMDIIAQLQENDDYKSYERINRLKTLVLPKGMGEKFKILIQAKNITDTDLESVKILPYQSQRYRI